MYVYIGFYDLFENRNTQIILVQTVHKVEYHLV